MRIKLIHLEQFKGVTEADYCFSDLTKICGQNGAGKSTIADAIFWVLIGKNYQLKDNPEIRNYKLEESLPLVRLVMDIDGKEVTVSKQQKCKKSKPDENGVSKIALSNTYTWNEVPVTEKDYKQKFADAGIDLELFAELSHPDVFTKGLGDKKQKDHNRETLFKMCNSHTDIEIAGMFPETEGLVSLLKDYSVEEIAAMNKASLKRAKEESEGIPFQIVGMEKSRVDDSIASELELEKNALEDRLVELGEKIDTYELSKEAMELQFAKADYEQLANADLVKKTRELQDHVFQSQKELREIEDNLRNTERQMDSFKAESEKAQVIVDELLARYKVLSMAEFSETFDESIYDVKSTDKVCKACGQDLPAEAIEKIVKDADSRKENARQIFESKKKKFEIDKKAEIEKLIADGKEYADKRNKAKENANSMYTTYQKLQNSILDKKEEIAKLNEKLKSLPVAVDLTKDDTYLEFEKKILALNIKAEKIKEQNSANASEKAQVLAELEEVKKHIASIGVNSEIDKKIEELKERQIDLEQVRADAECVLYKLDLLGQKKNELLTDEINKHFSIVSFKMFDYQKNGEYKEVCIPMIGDKQFGQSMNTGLEVIAKLDICRSLQKFYGMELPIILDNAESINEDNIPDITSQLITLRVTNDKELQVNGN